MGPVDVFNAVEATWWMALSVVVLSAGRSRPEAFRGLHRPMAGFLFLFGLTDVAEIWTGAWWEPVGLAILNGLCVIGLAGCGLFWLRRDGSPGSLGAGLRRNKKNALRVRPRWDGS